MKNNNDPSKTVMKIDKVLLGKLREIRDRGKIRSYEAVIENLIDDMDRRA